MVFNKMTTYHMNTLILFEMLEMVIKMMVEVIEMIKMVVEVMKMVA